MIGDIIEIIDNIDYSIITTGTIRMIEPDNEDPELKWFYIRANDDRLNIQFDPRIGNYWRIIENKSEFIKFIKPATL